MGFRCMCAQPWVVIKNVNYSLFLLWKSRGSNSRFSSLFRGVGCIFVEMIQGVAAFPGMKDIQDQLERIFLVSSLQSASGENWFLIYPLLTNSVVVVKIILNKFIHCHI